MPLGCGFTMCPESLILETESGTEISRAWVEGSGELLGGNRVLVWGDGKVLETDGGDGHATW